MARQEQPREELLREATALVERAEFTVEGFAEPVVIGFRRDGAASVFIGADPVYQFNAAGQLRRAFVGGTLIKAQNGWLFTMTRERTPDAVNLITRPLAEDEAVELLQTIKATIDRLRDEVTAGRFQLVGEVSPAGSAFDRVDRWLRDFPAKVAVAERPNV